jgi:hypothetical protein
MSDDREYLEHLTLIEVAKVGAVAIDGDKVYRSHPWNVPLPPRPEPPPPGPVVRYRLTVAHDSAEHAAVAECDNREQLLELNDQFERIDYHFVKLERIEPLPA